MAHFAELDNNNTVLRVVVIGNDIETAAGPLGANDMHVDGETWCVNFFKSGNWKQTSYNNSFRKQYCGVGYTYDAGKDKFLSPQNHPSWTLDANDDWQAPVTYPTIGSYDDPSGEVYLDSDADFLPIGKAVGDIKILLYGVIWNEANLKWTAEDKSEPVNNFDWDPSTLSWVAV
tara:strand:+ start:1043 stop:1564 length:522 start_codon:yes stop_codon:yes gene_type:complete